MNEMRQVSSRLDEERRPVTRKQLHERPREEPQGSIEEVPTGEGCLQATLLHAHLDALNLFREIQHIERVASLTRDLAIDLSWSLDQDSSPSAQTISPPGADPISLPGGISGRDALRERIGRLSDLSKEVNCALLELLGALHRRVELTKESNGASATVSFRELLDGVERQLIVSALRACRMKQSAAASLLGLLPTTLSEKLKRLGLRSPKPPQIEDD